MEEEEEEEEEVVATQKRMTKQKEASDKLVDEWLNRAQLALQKDDDELAREALARKNQATEESANLATQLATQEVRAGERY